MSAHGILLSRALKSNAFFSALCSPLSIVFSDRLAEQIAFGAPFFVSLGVSLGVFSVILFLLSMRRWLGRPLIRWLTVVVIVLDALWAAGSFSFADFPSLTTEVGASIVKVTASIVAGLAFLQAYPLGRTVWNKYRRSRKSHPLSTANMLPLIVLLAAIGGCSPVDIKTDDLIESGFTGEILDRGQFILRETAEHHGLTTWKSHQTLATTAVDRWTERSPGWWPTLDQRVRIDQALDSFTSRAILRSGLDAGGVWGIHDWKTYTMASIGSDPVFDPETKELTSRNFYLPALHYFNELPFRLLHADIAAYAGRREYHSKSYDLVFVTWQSPEPSKDYDQYLLWIDTDTHLVAKCLYTFRDAGPGIYGTIHYENYRSVDGVQIPFVQTVTASLPENTIYPLDRYYFHRLEIDSAAFDLIQVEELMIGSNEPPSDSKPGSQE